MVKLKKTEENINLPEANLNYIGCNSFVDRLMKVYRSYI